MSEKVLTKRMNKTTIPFCDYTWNPFTGCSFGCEYCYARKVYERFGKDFTPCIHPLKLEEPRGLRKPSVIFCGSTGDVADCPPSFFDSVIDTMNCCPRHQFMMLTKRPEEARQVFSSARVRRKGFTLRPVPLNLWWGVTVTNQEDADTRIPQLLLTPAAHHFVSIEPMLGPVDLSPWVSQLDYVTIGAKSPGKPLHLSNLVTEWHTLVRQLETAGVPFMYKHSGSSLPKVGWIHPEEGKDEEVVYGANPVRDLLEAEKVAERNYLDEVPGRFQGLDRQNWSAGHSDGFEIIQKGKGFGINESEEE